MEDYVILFSRIRFIMALSKAKLKLIRSLEQKKYRKEHLLFVAEGPKLVEEFMGYFECKMVVATASWLAKNPYFKSEEHILVDEAELAKASFLKHPQQVLALFKQPSYQIDSGIINQQLCLALDGVQDPGNLGTIVRLADWFGIEHIFCSNDTVDIYNPKSIQATMGGYARVKVHYTALEKLIEKLPEAAIYGTFLDGENIYETTLSKNGLLIMGNEGKGISDTLAKAVTKKLYIPNYPINRESTESLNVAIATSITCAEFRRRLY